MISGLYLALFLCPSETYTWSQDSLKYLPLSKISQTHRYILQQLCQPGTCQGQDCHGSMLLFIMSDTHNSVCYNQGKEERGKRTKGKQREKIWMWRNNGSSFHSDSFGRNIPDMLSQFQDMEEGMRQGIRSEEGSRGLGAGQTDVILEPCQCGFQNEQRKENQSWENGSRGEYWT